MPRCRAPIRPEREPAGDRYQHVGPACVAVDRPAALRVVALLPCASSLLRFLRVLLHMLRSVVQRTVEVADAHYALTQAHMHAQEDGNQCRPAISTWSVEVHRSKVNLILCLI